MVKVIHPLLGIHPGHKHHGINENISQWIKGFLNDRVQNVVVERVSSHEEPVLLGVPHGTCLGPILFLCYVNDITTGINLQMRLFAGDVLLCCPFHSEHN